MASANGYTEIVRALLSHEGIDVHIRNTRGRVSFKNIYFMLVTSEIDVPEDNFLSIY